MTKGEVNSTERLRRNTMNRVFMFAYQKCRGEVGGGGGVEYRLYLANKKYSLLKDVYYIYKDRVIHNGEECGEFAKADSTAITVSPLKELIKRIIPNICAGMHQLRNVRQNENDFSAIIDCVDEQYHFDEKDIFIFHDMQFAHPFLKRYPFQNTVMILHCQGSYYNEWQAFTGRHFKPLHWYYKKRFEEIVARLRYLGFPAKGAEESFIESDPELARTIAKVDRIYLYNGIDIPEIQKESSIEWIEQLSSYSGYVFATVATLNEAKGVERIPEYLGALKRAGYAYKWILIGQGVKKDQVQSAITQADIEDNTIWIQDFVDHDEILRLLSMTDFYILFHRCSVFDLSTLEAMHYGAIPVLTPVGGNKDVLQDGNGLFVSDFCDVSSLITLLQSGVLPTLQAQNRAIQQEKYNDYAFLRRYAHLCEKMLGQSDS